MNRHTHVFCFASACTDSNIEIGGGRGEGKTWFKFSGVLADLDRKNTHSFVLPLSRPSDQSAAMNIATQCVSQFTRLLPLLPEEVAVNAYDALPAAASSGLLWAARGALGCSGHFRAALGGSGLLWAALGGPGRFRAALGSSERPWAALGGCT